MKIVSLRWKNLNSLYGQWSIDFTHSDYEADVIFALVGPTGAGKSTILDAICLALYGQTPRLGRITKSGNEVMSRNTGECFSEVVFESSQGTFRCFWEQHRARKNPQGNLLEAHHEISDVATGKPIETKKRNVPLVIEEKTGMDFDRFRRSMLLAQGNFDTFLKADAEQKSKILEQITGTEIYSTISQEVFQRLKQEKNTLELLQESIDGISILSETEIDEIKTNLAELNQSDKLTQEAIVSTNEAIQWLKTIEEINNELSDLNDQEQSLLQEKEDFKENQTILANAQRASKIELSYQLLKSKRKDQAAEYKEREKQKEQLNSVHDDLQEISTQVTNHQNLCKEIQEAIDTLKPTLKKVREYDQTLRSLNDQIAKNKKTIEETEDSITQEQSNLNEIESKKTKALESLEQDQNYLKEHKEDAKLIEILSGIKEQLNSFHSKKEESEQSQREYTQHLLGEFRKALSLVKIQNKIYLLNKSLDEITQQKQAKTKEIEELLKGKSLHELKLEKDHLQKEQRLFAKIEQLEQEREHLLSGQPCPLCGSTVHPYIDDTSYKKDSHEEAIDNLNSLINRCELIEADITSMNEKISLHQNNLNNEKHNEKREIEALEIEYQKGDTTKANLDKKMIDYSTLEKTLLQQLAPYGIEEIRQQCDTIVSTLQTRMNNYSDHQNNIQTIQESLHTIENTFTSLTKTIALYQSNLENQRKNTKTLEEEYTSLQGKRELLFGTKDPDNEETQLENSLKKAQNDKEQINLLFSDKQNEQISLETTIKNLSSRLTQREKELIVDEESFLQNLREQSFKDEQEFIDAQRSSQEIERLEKEEKRIEERANEIKTQKSSCKRRLDQQLQKNLTSESMESLQSQATQYQTRLDTLRAKIGEQKFKLMENDKALSQIKEKKASIDKQLKEVLKWEKLSSLIGSADGKKYRNFAQGLTFEVMISHANDQLRRMNDRYLLSRDLDQVLELNVIDNYQAGEIRSTKNLSGGESFIISLSLALGLSQMASRKVRVDSLFLDEGFGTLDENALDSALETLSTLQQEGKIIGIISHVSLLKERINTKIVVTPTTGGKSKLEGPGVNHHTD